MTSLNLCFLRVPTVMAYAAVRAEFERVESGKKMFREKIASKWHRCAFATSVAALIAHGQAAANFEIALWSAIG